jgi:3-hydroxymyristoyl/3-hydroxydecanoyl-(acyl carrier protein) dehydratase
VTEATTPRRLLPLVETRHIDSTAARLTLQVPPDLAWFAGHFDNMPVLPGVVLIQWAAHFIAEIPGHHQFTGTLRALKFRRLVLPGFRLELTLELDPLRHEVSFCFRSNQGEHARGCLLLTSGSGH